jgi:hypothetical protein
LGDLNNFPLAFTICGILCFVAVISIALVKPAAKPLPKITSPTEPENIGEMKTSVR